MVVWPEISMLPHCAGLIVEKTWLFISVLANDGI
jgi:hypothetical protein